jgi:hypothetical protein
MGEALESACTHIEVWTAWPLLTNRGFELLLPLPRLVLSAAPKGGSCGRMNPRASYRPRRGYRWAATNSS